MTVIAFDGETLAADKRASMYGSYMTVTKLFQSGNKIVGFSGQSDRLGLFKAWFDAGADPDDFPENTGDTATFFIAISSDGTIEKYETNGYPIIIEEPFFATGSGGDFATAAMALGLNAAAAVEFTFRFNSSCGNGVDTLNLTDLKNDIKKTKAKVSARKRK